QKSTTKKKRAAGPPRRTRHSGAMAQAVRPSAEHDGRAARKHPRADLPVRSPLSRPSRRARSTATIEQKEERLLHWAARHTSRRQAIPLPSSASNVASCLLVLATPIASASPSKRASGTTSREPPR
ncbi:uncharacterized protein Tco025E_09832, partial [Trypanosoma conorhini]